jgi:hypothetical protein
MRFSIARMMCVVLVAAIGFAALRASLVSQAGLMLLVTCGVLMLGVVGTVCRGPQERACWLGFTLFGAGYLTLVHATAFSSRSLPTITLVEFIASEFGAKLDFSPANYGGAAWDSLAPTVRIVHCLWALALALLGCILAGLLVGRPAVPSLTTGDEAPSDTRLRTVRWKWAVLIGLAGFWSTAMAAAIGRWPAPGAWAGTSFLLTTALLGFAALAAAFRRDRSRAVWLGAALFGFGYLALTFGKSQLFIVAPHLPTEGLLNRLLRPGGPPWQSQFPDFTTARFTRVRNDVSMRKLDQPIPFHFPENTPLEDVLKYIRSATKDANFPGIPIYVDPVGLENAEKSMTSTVGNMDLDAIPVRDGLRLCMKQLDLEFSVREGFIMISDGDSATIPVYEDPVQVVGHSFLALIAAGLGEAAARYLCDRPRKREPADSATAQHSSFPVIDARWRSS